MSHHPVFSDICHTAQFSPIYVTQPKILLCMSHYPVFSNVCHTAQNSPMYVTPPSFLQCMSHSPEFSNVCHTTQFSPMYVTLPSFLRCMSHHPVFTQPRILVLARVTSHYEKTWKKAFTSSTKRRFSSLRKATYVGESILVFYQTLH